MKDGESKYAYKKKSAWELFSKAQLTSAFAFAEGYKTFLNEAKTEREAVRVIADAAKKGKKRMRQIGNVEVPQQAFLAVLKLD